MIKVGMIGCGDMARIHSEALALIPEKAELCAYQNIHSEKAYKFAERFGGKAYDTPESLLRDSGVDCVYICTRHDSHDELVRLALKYKKAIFCEKPLAFTLEESLALYPEIKKAGLPFTIGFNQRFTPGVIALRKYIQEHNEKPTIINMSMTCVNFLDGWMGRPEDGGGIMTSWLCHAFDLLRYITGQEIQSLSCMADRLRLPEGYCEDAGAVICRLSNNSIATISFHDHAPSTYVMDPGKDMVRIEMHTGKKSLICYAHDKFSVYEAGKVQTISYGPYSQNYSWGYEEFNEQYIDMLAAGGSLKPDEKDGLIAAILVEAMSLR